MHIRHWLEAVFGLMVVLILRLLQRCRGFTVFSHSTTRCNCKPDFDSDLCKQTKLSFEGDGLAWFVPLSACQNWKLSIEILTNQASSLILYNGPMYDTGVDELQDFLSLELVNGYPRVRINLGDNDVNDNDPPLVLMVNGPAARQLNNGQWHTIELFANSVPTGSTWQKVLLSKISLMYI